MHGHPMVVSLLALATNAAAADPNIFYTAQFADSTATSLSLLGNTLSQDSDYDFDVLIGLTEIDSNGTVIYVDSARHPARVRCSAPAKVRIGEVDYPVGAALQKQGDWKLDLWRAVCVAYVS